MPTLPELDTLTDDRGTTYQLVDREARNGLDNKQNSLTPGDDISIENDVISYNGPAISDGTTTDSSLWSSSKISTELSGKASASTTYTKTEVDNLVAACTHRAAVAQLPTTNIDPNTIYYVPNGSLGNNIYDEYMYINNQWELLGSTEIDLSNYYTKTQTNALLSPLATKEEVLQAQMDNVNITLGTNKNLIAYPYDGHQSGDTIVSQGVTFVINADKTISVSGTDSDPQGTIPPQLSIADSDSISHPLPSLVAGHKYRLSGCPVQESQYGAYLYLNVAQLNYSDYGTGVEFTIPSSATGLDDWSVKIIASGVVNLPETIFTPQLVDLDASYVELADVAFSGDYNDLKNKPSIPDVSVYYTKTETDTMLADKADSSDLAQVAFSGDYNDLINTPNIPTVPSISVTQKLSSGVEIASIEIDNQSTSIYAPSGGGASLIQKINGNTSVTRNDTLSGFKAALDNLTTEQLARAYIIRVLSVSGLTEVYRFVSSNSAGYNFSFTAGQNGASNSIGCATMYILSGTSMFYSGAIIKSAQGVLTYNENTSIGTSNCASGESFELWA